MPQLSKGDTFADTQQLTATRLNQLVDSATILVGVISEQTPITANTLEATDTTIVNDNGVLKKATVGDFVGSGVPVVTKTITATAKNDVKITTFDADPVITGNTYNSTNGSTVIVTTTAIHGLTVGQFVLITGAGTGYNGTFRVNAVTTYTFTYVLDANIVDANNNPVAGSGICQYTPKGTLNVDGNESVSGRLQVVGNTTVSGTMYADGAFRVKGASEFNIAPTIGNKSIPQLYEITEVAIPTASWGNGNSDTSYTWDVMWNSSTYVKGVDEMWIVELDMKVMNMSGSTTNALFTFPVKWKLETVTTVGSNAVVVSTWCQKLDYPASYFAASCGYSFIALENFHWKYVINKNVAFDGKFRISAKQTVPQGWANQTDGFTSISPVSVGTNATQAYYQADATSPSSNNLNFPWVSIFRIFKYKSL